MDHINKLLSFIPDDKLQHIAFDTAVDKYALECALFQAMGNKFNTSTVVGIIKNHFLYCNCVLPHTIP